MKRLAPRLTQLVIVSLLLFPTAVGGQTGLLGAVLGNLPIISPLLNNLLLPLVGTTLRSALADYPATPGLELDGCGLAFGAAKESEDGEWLVLRCVNLTDEPTAGRWQLPFAPREARLARLDETPLGAAPLSESTVTFTAAPHAVVTVLVR